MLIEFVVHEVGRSLPGVERGSEVGIISDFCKSSAVPKRCQEIESKRRLAKK